MQLSTPIAAASRRRAWFIGLSAGFVAGVSNAVVARILMRVIALAAFGHGSFSVAGTAVIFMFGALTGPLLGLVYRGALYRLPAHALIRGLLFGLGLITLQAPALRLAPDFARELMAIGPLGVGAFAGMSLGFALTLAVLTEWLETAWPSANGRRQVEVRITAALGLLALGGLGLLAVEIGGRLLGMMK